LSGAPLSPKLAAMRDPDDDGYQPSGIWSSPLGCLVLGIIALLLLAIYFVTNCGPHGCGFP
jgi:hypothetical protein